MWVKRSKWDALAARVAKLENEATLRVYERAMWPPRFYKVASKDISVKDVVLMLLQHSGVKLEYTDAAEAIVTLKPLDRIKVNPVPKAK